MQTADWALVVSLLSLCVALAGFVWNVWSKFIYPKARLQLAIGNYIDGPRDQESTNHYIVLSAVNHGPTDATVKVIVARTHKWHTKLTRRFQYAIIKHWGTNRPHLPSIDLPKRIVAGEQVSFFFDASVNWFENDALLQVGLADVYGRNHWVPMKEARKLRRKLAECQTMRRNDESKP